VFIAYTSRIIEGMGGRGPRIDDCSREIYDEWAACHHFELYDDVPGVLRTLAQAGIRIGLISNTQRCLTSFQSHFELDGLIAGAISSFEHGRMKPHPSIFEAALARVGAEAADAVMVGDSLRQDIEGALRAGMRAILLHRGDNVPARAAELGVPVIRSLRELPPLL
jgi:putative hydrolase of the HAD superfamily